jgi:alpha-galactosidase
VIVDEASDRQLTGSDMARSNLFSLRRVILSLFAAVAFASPATAQLQAPAAGLQPRGKWSITSIGNAPTPPMGWNSWNAFYTDIDEEKVLASAKAIVDTGLAKKGYRYINVDDGWWLKRRQPDGRLLVRTNLFPSANTGGPNVSSFRPFVDRIHAMGLKAGIYTDIGYNSCSQTDPESENLPEGTRSEREVGIYGHVDKDIRLFFQEWGFDYIKIDACGLNSYGSDSSAVAKGYYRAFEPLIINDNVYQTNIPAVQTLYGEVRSALIKHNPDGDFVYSMCNWGTANVRAWGKDFGNLWRTSFDIKPEWTRMLHTFDTVVTRELYAGPGRWNDPDMLFIGHGDFDKNHLVEAQSHFALWAITAAPLLIGFDLRDAPKSLLDIWGAQEIIAVNQDKAGNQGVLAYSSDDLQIIVKSLLQRGQKAVVLFNRSTDPMRVSLTAQHLKMLETQPISLRDIRTEKDMGTMKGERAFTLQPRETIILKAVGTPILDNGLYLSEMPARINVAVDGIVALEADPMIHRVVTPRDGGYTQSNGERPQYAGWGGPRADSTPYDETIRINKQEFRSGIGILANSRLEVKADRGFDRFEAEVGIDDSTRGRARAVTFEVYGDGKLIAKSAPQRFGQKPAKLSASVRNVSTIELIARADGPDTGPIIVAWANAQLQSR